MASLRRENAVNILKTVAALVIGTSASQTVTAETPTGYIAGHEFNTPEGETIDWSVFKGKTVLLVNVASRCGFTPQYEALQDLQDAYGQKPFMIVGVPSNDFGGQAPESDADYKEFCAVNFDRPITFTHTQKTPVKGKDAHPFYKWARESFGEAAEPKWNFHKLLLDSEGRVVAAYGSRTKPGDQELIATIDDLISKATAS
jgi:glutathione peroxidase